jgi:copper chaperone CopZ
MTSRLYSLSILISSFAVSGCAEATNEPAGIARKPTTAAVFNAAGGPTVKFSVPDMMCEDSCVPTVRETLADQPGVKDVKVELKTKTATVAVDEKEFDADAAIAALVDLQFTQTKLATDAADAPDSGAQTQN